MKNKTFLEILRYGLLVFALAYTFVFVIAGFGNHMDPFYWMGLCKEHSMSFMTIGTIALGHAWIQMFGASVITMRLLAWILTLVAMAIPYICLLDKEQRIRNLHWLAICYCLLGYGVFQEYSAGTLSVFLFSILATVWVLYLRNERWIYMLPIITAMAISARFPNVVVLLFLGILLPIYGATNHKLVKKILIDESIFIFGSILILGGLYAILGVDMSWASFEEVFSSHASGVHALDSMINALVIKSGSLLFYTTIWIVLGFIVFFILRLKNEWLRWLSVLVLAGLMGIFLKFSFSLKDWYNANLHYFLSSATIALALYVIVQASKEKNWFSLFIVISLLLIGCVVPLGSDTAWLKLFPIYLCFIPVLIGLCVKPINKERYLYPMLIVFCGYVMVTYCFNPIGSKSLFQGKVFGSQPLFHYVFIPQSTDDYLNQVAADYAEFGKDGNTIAVGDGAHLCAQLTGAQTLQQFGFWSNIDDSIYVSKVSLYVEEKRPVVFCLHTPKFVYQDENIGDSMLEDKLCKLGYEIIDRSSDCYMIYRMRLKEE